MSKSPPLVAGADVVKGRWIVVVLDDGAYHQAVIIDRLDDLPPHLPDVSLLALGASDLDLADAIAAR